ncbi:MAG TPA: alkaline phosphatase family protein, partial [Opitutus sp.]|nr:alkaline phosphatase family protein [Opitutus sp.]
MRSLQRRLLRSLVIVAGFLGLAAGLRAVTPSLVVVISIDQFRGDYFDRFRQHFGAGGFNLFLDHGANFVDCHFRHSHTKTGPGHAVMLTGVHANLNGIIGNDWIDRGTLQRVSCVGDPSVAVVGLPPPAGARLPGIDDPYLARSPVQLTTTTVGDQLKLARGGQPKVIGIAGKDRSAILMSGKNADAAYFMKNGRMVTSTYYMQTLPAWVEAWNAAGKIDAYFGRTWERVLPEAAYAVQGPDDMPGEDIQAGRLGNTLPKTVNGGEAKIGPRFYGAFDNTPFHNEVVEDFAETAITHEQLGLRPGITDMLCLSFSANDSIGHLYGPDSHEIMDNVVRMDRTLEKFFQFLDRHMGLKNCTIVMTADHGVASTPEHIRAIAPQIPSGRIDGAALLAAVEGALNQAFGPLADNGRWTVRDDASFLLHPQALAEKNVDSAGVQAVLRDALLKLDFVQAAYTRVQLENGEVSDELGRAALLSFNRERSGDVFFQPKPYFFSRGLGSNHG